MFDQALSLGAWCQTAWQIKRVFGSVAPGPFNDVVIPWRSIEPILADFSKSVLRRPVWVLGESRVMCGDYGITFIHQFPLNPSGASMVDDASIARCQSDMRWRFDNFDVACRVNRPTLFVRHGTFCEWHEPWPYIREDKILSAADVAPVVAAIRARYPELPFKLCIAYEADLAAVDPAGMPRGVYLHPFHGAGWRGRAPEDMWKGNDAAWDGLFARMEEEIEWA